MHHQGQVITHDGEVIGYFEYDDRTAVCLTRIWDTQDELHAQWRQGHTANCTCGRPPVDAWLYELNYVPGSHWPGKVCTYCNAIVAGIQGSELSDPWPKDGHPMGLPEDDGLPPA